MLSDEDLGSLYDLLIDDAPQIRHAVGDLVYDHLICPASEGWHSSLICSGLSSCMPGACGIQLCWLSVL